MLVFGTRCQSSEMFVEFISNETFSEGRDIKAAADKAEEIILEILIKVKYLFLRK